MQSSSTAGLNPHLARDSRRSWTQNHLWCRYTIWLVNQKALSNITAKTLVQEKWFAPFCPVVSTTLETIHFKWVPQYHKQKGSYHGPYFLFLATQAATAEAACHQKAKSQKCTELGLTAARAALKWGESRSWEPLAVILQTSPSHSTPHAPWFKSSSNNQE